MPSYNCPGLQANISEAQCATNQRRGRVCSFGEPTRPVACDSCKSPLVDTGIPQKPLVGKAQPPAPRSPPKPQLMPRMDDIGKAPLHHCLDCGKLVRGRAICKSCGNRRWAGNPPGSKPVAPTLPEPEKAPRPPRKAQERACSDCDRPIVSTMQYCRKCLWQRKSKASKTPPAG